MNYSDINMAVAKEKNIVKGKHYRFTVLTDRMIRMEYNVKEDFRDCMTQAVVNRAFPLVDFQIIDTEDQLEIITKCLHLIYNKKPFCCSGLYIYMKNNPFTHNATWYYGDECEANLKGTVRTLDNVDGAVPLEAGLLSNDGFSVLDDSASLEFDEEGWIKPARKNYIDQYFLSYGHDYKDCLKDFYVLCGKTPMLPKYALGNWWSRYYEYTQEEYLELMERFNREDIPFSVAVIDMDWHLVNIDTKYGNGWTGYTWNRELFPEPEKMLEELHNRGLAVTLNVHPAEGVRAHEEMYLEMAKELKVDFEKEEPIKFDIANRKFLDAYFKYLHRPQEEKGVDFWWIDWQQGTKSKIEGLDPLWMLNHYHFIDNGRGTKRPMIFSRYAGVGSHRYPIGFSGDTIVSWDSLKFQPYFTATASNIGYGWWSHDIGGHMMGIRDDELGTRWIQFGVFSPIMRLHSAKSIFTGKEPWKYSRDAEQAMKKFLQLRHKMIPYLYTMNWRASEEGEPLIQPMYYNYPIKWEAYQVQNQYYFGSELIVHPITDKINPVTKRAKVTTWLPEGIWYDVLNGLIYEGGRKVKMFRTLDEIPVLAKVGAIVPLERDIEFGVKSDNPRSLELLVFAGANGSFTLYEDDGHSNKYLDGNSVTTTYHLQWEKEKAFIIKPAVGELSLIPNCRDYKINFYGLSSGDIKEVLVEGVSIKYLEEVDDMKNILTINISDVDVSEEITIRIQKDAEITDNNVSKRIYEVLNQAQISYEIKMGIYANVNNESSLERKIKAMSSIESNDEIKDIVEEILLAK